MAVTRKRVLKTVPAILVVLVLAVWSLSYHPSQFKGGIAVCDSGFFSYPRYHAQLGHVPLWKAGEYRFSVRGLPPGPLDLALWASDGAEAEHAELPSLSTTVSVWIADSFGAEVCSASGRLSEAKLSGRLAGWASGSSSSHASFWSPRCQNLPISRFKPYTVKVAVSDVDLHSPQKTLIPVLEGGGNELP
jgi:hypothetical protein